MKPLISDWVLATKPEPGGQTSQPSSDLPGIYSDGKLPSDEIKFLHLVHLYLELRLNLEQAFRAAKADIAMAPKAPCRRRWVEQPQ
jgi:hypothetical protein